MSELNKVSYTSVDNLPMEQQKNYWRDEYHKRDGLVTGLGIIIAIMVLLAIWS